MFKIESKAKKEKWILSTRHNIEQNFLESFHIEISGKHELTIEGCLGVYEYRSDYIKLHIKNGFTVITGYNFDIVNYESNIITVRGVINSIEFSD